MTEQPEHQSSATSAGNNEGLGANRGASTSADAGRASSTYWKEHTDPWRQRADSGSNGGGNGPSAREQKGPSARERSRARRAPKEGADEGARPVVGIVRELLGDVWLLARQELQLVRAEAGEKVEQAKKGASELAVGAALTYAGILFVLLAAVLGLDEVLDRPWLSALIVGGCVLGIGYALLATARSNLKARNLIPERSARSLREDAALVRDEVNQRTHA